MTILALFHRTCESHCAHHLTFKSTELELDSKLRTPLSAVLALRSGYIELLDQNATRLTSFSVTFYMFLITAIPTLSMAPEIVAFRIFTIRMYFQVWLSLSLWQNAASADLSF